MTPGLVLTPRRPRGAGGGEEQAGEARCPSPPQTLFAGEVGREGHSITGLAAAGSSRHWQKIAAIPASAGIPPRSWSSNANSLCRQIWLDSLEIYATFQRDILRTFLSS